MGTIIMAQATLARLLPTMAIGTTSTSGPMTHHLLVVIDHQGGVLTTGCQHAKQVKQCSPNSMQEDRTQKTWSTTTRGSKRMMRKRRSETSLRSGRGSVRSARLKLRSVEDRRTTSLHGKSSTRQTLVSSSGSLATWLSSCSTSSLLHNRSLTATSTLHTSTPCSSSSMSFQ